MDSKITSINQKRSGFVLSEMLVVMGITTILSLAVMSFFMLSGRSFSALFNYVDLDDANRVCMDQLSRDIRQANRVTDFTASRLVLEDADRKSLSYVYTNRTLVRTKQDESSMVVLRECDTLKFDVCQRNPVGGSYDVYPAATVDTAKVIDVSWVCSRTIFGRKENTESVQTARIVIRKQGT